MEENDQEFLRALHEEKIRTQNERTQLVTMKLAFITVLFGLSSVNVGIDISDIFWLLYFVPLVAISYDLYIMSADSRIKRVGIFLGRNPVSLTGKAEREWERFCTSYRLSDQARGHLSGQKSGIIDRQGGTGMGALLYFLSRRHGPLR